MLQSHHLLFRLSPPLHNRLFVSPSSPLHFSRRLDLSSFSRSATETETEGPIEIPFSSTGRDTLFATDDNPTTLQVATSVLLTGSISVFLFRALRRRAKRVKEMRMRSSGMSKVKDPKEEALQTLKAIQETSIDPSKPPSVAQAFLGSIAAGVMCLILYKFATTVEASLNRQAISDNFSVRQITITVRTIVNGLCYLATFVFGINSVGLLLYSFQLALGSIFGNDSDSNKSAVNKEGEKLTLSEESMDKVGPPISDLDQNSDKSSSNSSSQ